MWLEGAEGCTLCALRRWRINFDELDAGIESRQSVRERVQSCTDVDDLLYIPVSIAL